ELRLLGIRRDEQRARGEAGAGEAARLEGTIDALETKLGLRGDTFEAEQRRRAVDVQIEVQNDAARRDRGARGVEGGKAHPGIELHSHFLGIVEAEVFRKRAAVAAGGDNGSWGPLLRRIASLVRKDPAVFGHATTEDGAITRRAAAGDAVKI